MRGVGGGGWGVSERVLRLCMLGFVSVFVSLLCPLWSARGENANS